MRRQYIGDRQQSRAHRFQSATTKVIAPLRRRQPPIKSYFCHWPPFLYPSVRVLMKATRAFSSSSLRPRFPSWREFMFASTSGAARHDVARIIEMNDVLEAGEIPIVHIGFYEGRVWPLVDVTQRWNSHLAG